MHGMDTQTQGAGHVFTSFTGVVLAGGRGERLGRDKGTAVLAGVELAQRVL